MRCLAPVAATSTRCTFNKRWFTSVATEEIATVLTNARMWCPNMSTQEMQANNTLAITTTGKIAYVGTSERVGILSNGYRGIFTNSNADVIDLDGKFLLPGFTDSHLHFLDGGLRLLSVQLRDVRSREEFTNAVKDFRESNCKPGDWIMGGDWDHFSFGDGDLPNQRNDGLSGWGLFGVVESNGWPHGLGQPEGIGFGGHQQRHPRD